MFFSYPRNTPPPFTHHTLFVQLAWSHSAVRGTCILGRCRFKYSWSFHTIAACQYLPLFLGLLCDSLPFHTPNCTFLSNAIHVTAFSIKSNLATACAFALALLWLEVWSIWVIFLVQRGVGGLDVVLCCMSCIACVHVAYHILCLYAFLVSFLLE
jgi:hypothetical protein